MQNLNERAPVGGNPSRDNTKDAFGDPSFATDLEEHASNDDLDALDAAFDSITQRKNDSGESKNADAFGAELNRADKLHGDDKSAHELSVDEAFAQACADVHFADALAEKNASSLARAAENDEVDSIADRVDIDEFGDTGMIFEAPDEAFLAHYPKPSPSVMAAAILDEVHALEYPALPKTKAKTGESFSKETQSPFDEGTEAEVKGQDSATQKKACEASENNDTSNKVEVTEEIGDGDFEPLSESEFLEEDCDDFAETELSLSSQVPFDDMENRSKSGSLLIPVASEKMLHGDVSRTTPAESSTSKPSLSFGAAPVMNLAEAEAAFVEETVRVDSHFAELSQERDAPDVGRPNLDKVAAEKENAEDLAPPDDVEELPQRHRAECQDLADACGRPVAVLDECVIDLAVLAYVPRVVAERFSVLPLAMKGAELMVAVAGAPNESVVADVAASVGKKVAVITCALEHLRPLQMQAYALFERHKAGVLRGKFAESGTAAGVVAAAQPMWISSPDTGSLNVETYEPNPFDQPVFTGESRPVSVDEMPEIPMPRMDDDDEEALDVEKLIGTKRKWVGNYRIKRTIGKGGMAVASLAVLEGPFGFEKQVVLKRIREERMENPRIVEMFLREARLSAALNHPNIAQTFDLGVDDGMLFLAMEYIDGLTLRALCRASWAAGRSVPVDVILRATAEAAEGLAFLHALGDDEGKNLGFVHRDISPDNIMVGKDGRTRLLDFGLAKAAASEDLTQVGELKGKAPFMAPEQINVQRLDGRADLWALGVSLYWMLTGRLPFRGKNHILTLKSILHEAPPLPSVYNPEIEAPVERLVMDMLQKDPKKRISDGWQVQERIHSLLDDPLGEQSRVFVREMVQQEELCPSDHALIRFSEGFYPAIRLEENKKIQAFREERRSATLNKNEIQKALREAGFSPLSSNAASSNAASSNAASSNAASSNAASSNAASKVPPLPQSALLAATPLSDLSDAKKLKPVDQRVKSALLAVVFLLVGTCGVAFGVVLQWMSTRG